MKVKDIKIGQVVLVADSEGRKAAGILVEKKETVNGNFVVVQFGLLGTITKEYRTEPNYSILRAYDEFDGSAVENDADY